MIMIAMAVALQAAPPAPAPPPAGTPAIITTASGLRFQVLAPGTGRRPGPGDAVRVTYEGRLADGTVFDSAVEPAGILVSNTVPGFREALLMMNRGGRYRFWIPARLAYGTRGLRRIVPPDADLDFTLTLVGVGRPAQAPRRR
ncbi:MAG TPA: FKBP-type peptidyl-prolyl cis-trans isomerase [Allosphingosinicella sp.]|jgi:FKBP-type peptidyl-prolyl cis-trans isomerase